MDRGFSIFIFTLIPRCSVYHTDRALVCQFLLVDRDIYLLQRVEVVRREVFVVGQLMELIYIVPLDLVALFRPSEVVVNY